MGGAFFVNGNIDCHSEANIRGDPIAADYVFEHTRGLFVVGLDVTLHCPFEQSDVQALSNQTHLGSLLGKIYTPYIDFYREQRPGMKGAPPHDAIALLSLLHPEIFEWKLGPVEVLKEGFRIGKTVFHKDPSKVPSRSFQNIAVGGEFESLLNLARQYITKPCDPLEKFLVKQRFK